MQVIETTDREEFNKFLIAHNASVLQSWQWGEFNKKLGRKVWRLMLFSNTKKPLSAATLIKMPLPRGRSYFYCPCGPVIPQSPHIVKIWQLFLDKLLDFVLIEKPIFLRADPPLSAVAERGAFEQFGFRKIDWEIQPRTTLLLDLKKSEEQLLHQMKPKTRYNINVARRRGVTVEQTTDAKKIKIFWELLQETTARDRFSAHPYIYYFNLLDILGRQQSAELFIASYQRRPLAAAIVSYFGSTATYLHGASSERMRAVMAPYLAQWAAIQSAQARGMHTYDFGGSAPADAPRSHPWAGITRFKRGFGGEEETYAGAYDLPYEQVWYVIYRVARKLRRWVGSGRAFSLFFGRWGRE